MERLMSSTWFSFTFVSIVPGCVWSGKHGHGIWTLVSMYEHIRDTENALYTDMVNVLDTNTFFFKWTTQWGHGWETACTQKKRKRKEEEAETHYLSRRSLLPSSCHVDLFFFFFFFISLLQFPPFSIFSCFVCVFLLFCVTREELFHLQSSTWIKDV